MKKLLIATVATLAMGAVALPAIAQATLAPAEWTSNGGTINSNSIITSTTTAASTGNTGRILLTASNGATAACHVVVATNNSFVGNGGEGFVSSGDLALGDCVSNLCAGTTASNNSTMTSQLSYDTSTGTIVNVISGISFTLFIPCVGPLTFTGTVETMATHDANACGGNGGVILEFLNSATGGTLSGPGGLTARLSGFQEVCLDDGTDLDVEIP